MPYRYRILGKFYAIDYFAGERAWGDPIDLSKKICPIMLPLSWAGEKGHCSNAEY